MGNLLVDNNKNWPEYISHLRQKGQKQAFIDGFTLNKQSLIVAYPDLKGKVIGTLYNDLQMGDTVGQYEVKTLLTILQPLRIEELIRRAFNLYGIDSLKFSEFVLMIQACLLSLCKLKQITLPDYGSIYLNCKRIFIQMNADKSITAMEFVDYIKSNQELSDFMLQHYWIQSTENVNRRIKKMMVQFQFSYQKSVGLSEKYVCVKELEKYLKKQIGDSDTEYLIKILIEMQNRQVSNIDTSQQLFQYAKYRNYQHVVLNYSAFKANDVLNANEIDSSLYPYLLFGLTQQLSEIEYQKTQIKLSDWMLQQCITQESAIVAQIQSYRLLKKKDPVSVNKFIRKITDCAEYLIEIDNNQL